MTLILEHRQARRATGARFGHTFAHFIRALSGRIVSAWERSRLERELESMPYDLRKDIGFRSAPKTATQSTR